MCRQTSSLIIFGLILGRCLFSGSVMAQESVLVFAAASTYAPVTEAIKDFGKRSEYKITVSFAGSSTLAQQISQGAPADLYLSANTRWVDFLEDKGLVKANDRSAFLTNQLVLIGSKGREKQSGFEFMHLPQRLGDNRIALGDPDHVPAGIYAKAALVKLGIWEQLRRKITRQPNVTSALALVERNEVPYGIVYATDAQRSEKVDLVAVFPKDSHPEISYVLAKVSNQSTKAAEQFYEFLLSEAGQTIFKRYGFEPLGDK